MLTFSRYTMHLLTAAFIGSSLQGCVPVNADTRFISLGEQWKPFDEISTTGFSVQSPFVWQSRRLEFGVIGTEGLSGNQRFEFLRTWLGVRIEPVDWRRIAEASPLANAPRDPSAILLVQSAEHWIPYIGGGLTQTQWALSDGSSEFTDTTMGMYIKAGVSLVGSYRRDTPDPRAYSWDWVNFEVGAHFGEQANLMGEDRETTSVYAAVNVNVVLMVILYVALLERLGDSSR